MFSKKHRLSRTEFETHFKTGKRLHSPDLTMIYTQKEHTQVAVVVGKKVARKAHERNRLRRRIYGIAYRALKGSGVTGAYILLAKPSSAKLTKNQQKESVQNTLNRITIAT